MQTLTRLSCGHKSCAKIASSALLDSTSTTTSRRPQHQTKTMPSPLHYFMSDLLLKVHSVTAATIVVDNARSSQKTKLPASMSSTAINHSCSRWREWCCIEQPVSIIASSTTQSSSSSINEDHRLSSDDRSSLPPLQRRAPLVISNHSIPTCPQRQLSRDIQRRAPLVISNHSIPTCPQRQLSRDINDDNGNEDNNTEQQDPHRPSFATISMYALPTTPTFQSRLQIKISPQRDTIDAIAEEDALIYHPIRRLSNTLGVSAVTSQAPTCPVRRESPSPRHAAFRLPMMDEERDSSMDIVPPMPPFLTSRTSISSVSSTESDGTDNGLCGTRHRPPVCTSQSSNELVHDKRATISSSSSRDLLFYRLATSSSR
jgi:hypothetical protein